MQILLNSTLNKIIILVLILVLFVTPFSLLAATSTYSYQPQTIQEKIAYLYGRIAQIQEMIELREGAEDTSSDDLIIEPKSTSKDIEIDTFVARDIRKDEADLRGRIHFEDGRSAIFWFEYGESGNSLNKKTRRQRIYSSDGEDQTITVNIDRLDENERYYFRAVGEDDEGDLDYGATRYFETDENSRVSLTYDFNISVSDTSIDVGDEVEVDWEVPDDNQSSRNWIGLFERRADNKDYKQYVYLKNDTDGTVEFTIEKAEIYEFRLFLDNSYDDEITSDRVKVK